jgi:hypothetical protein
MKQQATSSRQQGDENALFVACCLELVAGAVGKGGAYVD